MPAGPGSTEWSAATSRADQVSIAIARLAQAGAEAILTQARLETWLDSATSAALLGVTTEELLKQVEREQLPTIRGQDGQPRFHRRDVSLHRLCQQLDGTEQVVSPLRPRDISDAEAAAWGFDPWIEHTPG